MTTYAVVGQKLSPRTALNCFANSTWTFFVLFSNNVPEQTRIISLWCVCQLQFSSWNVSFAYRTRRKVKRWIFSAAEPIMRPSMFALRAFAKWIRHMESNVRIVNAMEHLSKCCDIMLFTPSLIVRYEIVAT